MPITPNDIRRAEFAMAANGYEATEVDDFLDGVATEIDHMMKRLVELKMRCSQYEERAQAAANENAALKRKLKGYESSTLNGQLSETQLSEVFVIAKQTADTMIAEAETKAEGIVAEAEIKARDTIRQALTDKQKELDEINRLQQSRVKFCNDYQSLLRHYLEDSATQLEIAEENISAAQGRVSNASQTETAASAPQA